MSFHELIAQVAALPLRAAPLADVQARLDKLTNRVADPFHTLLTKVARHDTAGAVWGRWALAARPTLRPGAICLGLLADGSAVWHSLTSNPLGKATRASFGEESPMGEFIQFVAAVREDEPLG